MAESSISIQLRRWSNSTARFESGACGRELAPKLFARVFMDAVANGIIKQRQNCIDVLTFTFYRRLLKIQVL